MRASAILLLGALLVLGGMELGARLVVPRASKIQRRIAGDAASMEALRQPGVRRRILFIGDSLTLHAVHDLSPWGPALDAEVYRYAIEDTSRLDWVYQLRRLAGEGARADLIVLGTRPPSIAASREVRPISMRMLVATRDLPELVLRTAHDATDGSRIVLAHLSQFAALRQEINKVALRAMFPGLDELSTAIGRRPDVATVDAALIAEMRSGLEELDAAAKLLDARLVVWIPPVVGSGDPRTDALLALGDEARVTVMMPVPDGALDASEYTDGMHLAPSGAAKVMPALVERLKQLP